MGKEMSENIFVKRLKEQFPSLEFEYQQYRGDDIIKVPREKLFSVIKFFKEDPELDCDMLVDLTCVDYLGEKPRFELVYHLRSMKKLHMIRVKTRAPEGDPTVDSLTPLYKIANWFEREVWDMYGVKFNGHPDLRRILLYEEFEGHPLRKDYPRQKEQPLVLYRDQEK